MRIVVTEQQYKKIVSKINERNSLGFDSSKLGKEGVTRDEFRKFVKTINGITLEDKLKNLEHFTKIPQHDIDKSKNISHKMSSLMILATLADLLESYGPGSAGFQFEKFISAMADGEVLGGSKEIVDVYSKISSQEYFYSLKLISNPVITGSLQLLFDHLYKYPLTYIIAAKTSDKDVSIKKLDIGTLNELRYNEKYFGIKKQLQKSVNGNIDEFIDAYIDHTKTSGEELKNFFLTLDSNITKLLNNSFDIIWEKVVNELQTSKTKKNSVKFLYDKYKNNVISFLKDYLYNLDDETKSKIIKYRTETGQESGEHTVPSFGEAIKRTLERVDLPSHPKQHVEFLNSEVNEYKESFRRVHDTMTKKFAKDRTVQFGSGLKDLLKKTTFSIPKTFIENNADKVAELSTSQILPIMNSINDDVVDVIKDSKQKLTELESEINTLMIVRGGAKVVVGNSAIDKAKDLESIISGYIQGDQNK